jgi:transcription-repair coupling factor (superfamily II helicase)
MKLKWIAKKIGFERLLLKNGQMRAYFTTKSDSLYFESDVFGKILEYLKHHFTNCSMKEKNNKLSLVISEVNSATKAIEICKKILY